MAIKMRMPVRVTGVTLNKSSISLTTIGQTEQLTATITPANAEDTAVAWSSSDTTVATVSTTGLVTCVSPGDAIITVTTNDGGYTATCGVTDQSGWQPGANTIVYYPLDTDFNDYSGNGYNLTGHNSATIGTLNGVVCLDLSASQSYLSGTVSGIPQGTQARTEMFWATWLGTGWGYCAYTYGSASRGRADSIYRIDPITWTQYGNGFATTVYPTVGTWYHVAITVDGSTSQKAYVNGTLVGSGSLSVNTNGTTLNIGYNQFDGNYMNGYMSKFIIENRIWTAQEISDYYDSTKSYFGIS